MGGQATLFDEERRPVMELISTFKIAGDTRIKNVTLTSRRFQ
jgi:hypothetical protein